MKAKDLVPLHSTQGDPQLLREPKSQKRTASEQMEQPKPERQKQISLFDGYRYYHRSGQKLEIQDRDDEENSQQQHQNNHLQTQVRLDSSHQSEPDESLNTHQGAEAQASSSENRSQCISPNDQGPRSPQRRNYQLPLH